MGEFEEYPSHTSTERRIFTLERLPTLLAQGGDLDGAHRVLTDYGFLQAKVREIGARALLDDYDTILEGRFGLPGGLQPAKREDLSTLRYAIRAAAHVLVEDPRQLASQLWGRIHRGPHPRLDRLLDDAYRRSDGPWLRPATPSLAVAPKWLIQTLVGHHSPIFAVAVTPDGRHVISASYDHTLKVWDLESGNELRTLEGHSDTVLAVAVTPDGRHVISGSRDRTLKVWSFNSGDEVRTLEGHSALVLSVAVTPDGRRIVSGSTDHTVRVWDLESGDELRTFEGHSASVLSVAVTPDGRRVVSGSADKTVRVWDLESGNELPTLKGHSSGVDAVAVMPDGRRVVSGSGGCLLRVWDIQSGEQLSARGDHFYSNVAVAPDGQWVVYGSNGDLLKVWNIESGDDVRTLKGHSGLISGVAVTPDGQRVVSGSYDGTLKVWNLGSDDELRTSKARSIRIDVGAVAPDARHVGSRPIDRTQWARTQWALRLMRRAKLGALRGHLGNVNAVAVTPDGQRTVSGSVDGTLRVWDLDSGNELCTFESRRGPVRAMALTRNGRCAIFASPAGRSGRLVELDLESGWPRARECHCDRVVAMAVTPDGHSVVTGSLDGTLDVWDLRDRRRERHHAWKDGQHHVKALAVTPDGRHVISGSEDRTLKVWDLRKPVELLRRLEGHSGPVLAVAVAPNGRHAVSGSEDRTVRVWDLEARDMLCMFEGHSSPIYAVAVTPDGQRVISASGDHTLRVWDLQSASLLTSFTDEGALHCVCISPDGRTIITGGASRQVHFLRMQGNTSGLD